jgi:hypothetical protein
VKTRLAGLLAVAVLGLGVVSADSIQARGRNGQLEDKQYTQVCVNTGTGAARYTTSSETCRSNEEAVPLTSGGVPGPEAGADGATGATGPTGPQGPEGPQGPAGGPGVSGLEVVTQSTLPGSQPTGNVTVSCPAGKVAIGGGGSVLNGNSTVALSSSLPAFTLSTPTGWVVTAVETAAYAENWSLRAYAICAFVS